MKQVVQNYKTGELTLLDVAVPRCKPGGVLVRSRYSLISAGTELMKVGEARMSLAAKAKARPDQVAKVAAGVATNGLTATYRKAMDRLDSYTPLGYSLAGVVEQVGDGIDDVSVGDLLACAGNEHALHGELNWVPKNLYAPVPDGASAEHAAFGTVGAIALQGVRRGEPQLGEVALVIGLGLVGQLVVQLLIASGVRVLGADPDRQRCELAERAGAEVCDAPGTERLAAAVAAATGEHGVDQVYLVAGGSSNEPVELAARLARDRARVVDIGKCRLDLPWNAYYDKELDVRFSRSYGPGRYDPGYELDGRDYPIGYVRWTERRNLACFLDLVARGRVDVAPLIGHVADLDSAVETYQRLADGDLDAIAVLFRYPAATPEATPLATSDFGAEFRPESNGHHPAHGNSAPKSRSAPRNASLRLGFIGAGNYATAMLLPHLAGRADVELARVVTTTALSGANAKRKFGFTAAATETESILNDPAIDAVFVLTRHSSHADLTCRALRAGKAVFVEKPLALSESELLEILTTVAETGNDRLHVGFNRRFAPLLREAKQHFGARGGPATVRYLVNAGALEARSWYGRRATEGTRFDGEGGHFIDTVSWWLGDSPTSVFATAGPGHDDPQILLRYADGSTASITYASTGTARYPKETIEVLADGKVLRFDDFRRASLHGRKRWSAPRVPLGRDKGQHAQLAEFLAAVRTGGPMPIPLDSLVATTRATLAVTSSLATADPVGVDGVG